jgi:hypothetical protein
MSRRLLNSARPLGNSPKSVVESCCAGAILVQDAGISANAEKSQIGHVLADAYLGLTLRRRRAMRPAFVGGRFLNWLPLLAVAALFAANLYMAGQIDSLQKRVASLTSAERSKVEAPVGRQIADFRAVDHGGVPRSITFSDSPDTRTLLFIFSPQCSVCEKTWPQWSTLREKLAALAVRTIFIDQSGTASTDYLQRFRLESRDVLTYLPSRTAALLQVGATPQIIMMHPSGTVEGVWTGALTQTELDELVRSAGGSPSPPTSE